MDTRNVEKIVREVFGIEPLKLERMTVGRINTVYSVTLPDHEVIIRMNENPFVLKGTSRNISVLRKLGLPVPRVIMEDLTKERYPFHYMILEKIPGRDLRTEMGSMTKNQMTRLAETIVSFQQKVARLPMGTGYGWVPVNDRVTFARRQEQVVKTPKTCTTGRSINCKCLLRTKLQSRVSRWLK